MHYPVSRVSFVPKKVKLVAHESHPVALIPIGLRFKQAVRLETRFNLFVYVAEPTEHLVGWLFGAFRAVVFFLALLHDVELILQVEESYRWLAFVRDSHVHSYPSSFLDAYWRKTSVNRFSIVDNR